MSAAGSTALTAADVVTALLTGGASVDLTDAVGDIDEREETVRGGDIPTLVHTHPHTQNGYTALIIACSSGAGSLTVVNALLAKSANVTAQSNVSESSA